MRTENEHNTVFGTYSWRGKREKREKTGRRKGTNGKDFSPTSFPSFYRFPTHFSSLARFLKSLFLLFGLIFADLP